MNILVVTSHDLINDFSGTPKHILKLVKEYAKQGHKVLVLHLKKSLNFKIVKFEYNDHLNVNELSIWHWLTTSISIVKKFKPQVCIAFTYGAAVRFLPILKLYKNDLSKFSKQNNNNLYLKREEYPLILGQDYHHLQ